MNNEFNKYIRSIRERGMTHEEKGRILEHLSLYVAATEKEYAFRPVLSPWFSSASLWRSVFVGTFVLVFSVGGVSFASKGSLPGDLLYPVKIHVAEPVKSVFVVGDVARADFEVERIANRLLEVEVLAAEGALDDKTIFGINENIEKYEFKLDRAIGNMVTKGNVEQAVDARISLEASVDAHNRILSKIKDSAERDGVEDREEEREDRRNNDENKNGEIKEERPYTKESREKNDVRTFIEDTRRTLEEARPSDVASRETFFEDVEDVLSEAEEALERAEKEMESGNREGEYSSLLRSKRSVREAAEILRRTENISDIRKSFDRNNQSGSSLDRDEDKHPKGWRSNN